MFLVRIMALNFLVNFSYNDQKISVSQKTKYSILEFYYQGVYSLFVIILESSI